MRKAVLLAQWFYASPRTAENNAGARVLVVCSEITVGAFRAPSDENLSCLVNRAIVGDGAAALIVGAYPDINTERPLFHIVPTAQTILPDSEDAIKGHFREVGPTVHLSKNLSPLIADNIDKFLAEAFDQVSLNDHDWNSLFWMMHPIGPAVLDQIEGKLGLEKTKLRETRHVLSEYGNMASATILFVLDEMRKRWWKKERQPQEKNLNGESCLDSRQASLLKQLCCVAALWFLTEELKPLAE